MSDSNERNKAAMREKNSANLNTSGKEGCVVCSPNQSSAKKRPTGHVEVGTGKRS
jgi:hypothetical protein